MMMEHALNFGSEGACRTYFKKGKAFIKIRSRPVTQK